MLVASYNLSFAVQKDWNPPFASEKWTVDLARKLYGGEDQQQIALDLGQQITRSTQNAMEGLSRFAKEQRSALDILAIQEANKIPRPGGQEGFGQTQAAIRHLQKALTEEGIESDLDTATSAEVGPVGAHVVTVYNKKTMGAPIELKFDGQEAECNAAQQTGRPFLALYFKCPVGGRPVLFVNVHFPRVAFKDVDPAKLAAVQKEYEEDHWPIVSQCQAMDKVDYTITLEQMSAKIKTQAEKQGVTIHDTTRIMMAGDFNDELHVATLPSEDGPEYVVFLGRKLRLMDGLPRAAISMTPSAIKPTTGKELPYTAGLPDAFGKYEKAGYKLGATIDMIFDSEGFGRLSQEAGVIPDLDVKLQYYRLWKNSPKSPQSEMVTDVEFQEYWSSASNLALVGQTPPTEDFNDANWVAAVQAFTKSEDLEKSIVVASDHAPVYLKTIP